MSPHLICCKPSCCRPSDCMAANMSAGKQAPVSCCHTCGEALCMACSRPAGPHLAQEDVELHAAFVAGSVPCQRVQSHAIPSAAFYMPKAAMS